MSPSEVAAYLAVLPAHATEVHVTRLDGCHLSVKLGPAPGIPAAIDHDAPTVDEELPEGAYDPIAARKRSPR